MTSQARMPHESTTVTVEIGALAAGATTLTSFKLTVLAGPDTGASFPVEGPSASRLYIGTGSNCEVYLADSAISRRHAALSFEHGGLRIADLDSKNGIFLGTTRIFDVVLTGGESVTLGQTTLRVTHLGESQTVETTGRQSFGKLVGQSIEMRRLYPLLEKLAASDIAVILEGETGTGKEVLAESIHEESRRREAPFVVFDCTAVPPTLLESALFGHERGAFTGASSTRLGVFEQANGGTLLIDEIGELDLALQPKLLRAIQKSEVQRVGSNRWIKVDVRILAATRRDLDNEVQAGRFRDDLFYRLNVARIELPPLRKRRADIVFLAKHFCKIMGGADDDLPKEVLARFEDSPWPGNVRELYNAVARYLALGDLARARQIPQSASESEPAKSTSDDLVDSILQRNLHFPESRDLLVRAFERKYLERMLERHGGNVTRAAEAAGIARRYFHQLLARGAGEIA
jgi:two-component system, NtrC family, response regulator HydG